MSNARFSIIQAKAVRDERVSDAQLRVLNALGMYSDRDGWCFPSQSTLAEDINRSRQTVNGYIADLVDLGYVEKHKRYDNSIRYRLLFDTPLVEPALQGLSSVPDTNVPYNAPNTNTAAGENQPLPLEWQIAAGQQVITLPDQNIARMKDSANLISVGCGTKTNDVRNLAYAFMTARGIIIPAEKAKGNRKAAKSMLAQNVKPEHVIQAVDKLINGKKQLTCVDLFSVEKIAVDLANPPEVKYNGKLDGV